MRYSEISWKQEWFIKKQNIARKRAFFDMVKEKLNIKHPMDWGKLRLRDVTQFGDESLACFRSNLFIALKAVYPGILDKRKWFWVALEIEWKRSWFTRIPKFSSEHWETSEDRNLFLKSIYDGKLDRNKIVSMFRKGGYVLIFLYSLVIIEGIAEEIQRVFSSYCRAQFPNHKLESSESSNQKWKLKY